MIASRFETTPEQVARNARGLELCRAAIAPALAISERRDKRQTGPVQFAAAFPSR